MGISSRLKTSIKFLEGSTKSLLQQCFRRALPPPRVIAQAWCRDIWQPFKQQVLEQRQHIIIQEEDMSFCLVDGVPKRLEFFTYGWVTNKGRFYRLQPSLQFLDFDTSVYQASGEIKFTYNPHLFHERGWDDWHVRYPQYRRHSLEAPHELWGGTNVFDPSQFTPYDFFEVDGKEFWLLMWLIHTNHPDLRDPDISQAVNRLLRFYFYGHKRVS